MDRIWLIAAVAAEIIATSLLKETQGFTVLRFSLICGILYAVCHYCFSRCVLGMNLGIAYALWCGIGIIFTALVSVFVYRQQFSLWGLLGILLILAGVVLVDLKG